MTSNINGKARNLVSMIKKDKFRIKYMIDINISQLEIICHNDWREYLPSSANQCPCHKPRPSQNREPWHSYSFSFVEGKEILQRYRTLSPYNYGPMCTLDPNSLLGNQWQWDTEGSLSSLQRSTFPYFWFFLLLILWAKLHWLAGDITEPLRKGDKSVDYQKTSPYTFMWPHY